jgi:hypothetical protein
LGAAEARTLLFNLLHANPGAFPDRFQSTVMEALKALEFGEVLPLFEPDPAGKYRKVRYQEMQLQLWALALVEYRWAKWGRTAKLRAQNEVAEEYEVGTRTLREWQIPLRKELGRIMVDGVIGRARSCGDHAKKDKAFRLEHGDEIYGEKTLERAAERYKKLQANKAGAGAK